MDGKLVRSILFRISESRLVALRSIAKRERTPLSVVVRTLIEWGLQEYRRGKRKIVRS